MASSPASLTVASHPAAPEKSVVLKQSISINAESLHWEATAEVEVANVPAYQHEFQLSSDLQLEAVQLSQDDVGRLLDWSHDSNRLVLSLAGVGYLARMTRSFMLAELRGFSARLFGLPIDNILASDAVRVLDVRTLPPTGSDHLPVLVRFAIDTSLPEQPASPAVAQGASAARVDAN